MKNVYVVIGASYGDEGKGEVTNFLSKYWGKPEDSLVVRFNGGAQAGHTVSTKNAQHTFSHFGAGTLNGIATYLSKYFIINIPAFLREFNTLITAGLPTAPVYVNVNCPVTIITDVLINKSIETARGELRHGSCGVGINETVERTEAGYTLTVNDFIHLSIEELYEKIEIIYNEWIPTRLEKLGIKLEQTSIGELQDRKASILFMISDFKKHMRMMIPVVHESSILNKFNTVYFEGAQGLQLDQNSPDFPHVTRSNTGIKNVVSILKDNGYFSKKYRFNLTVYYVSRVYATRHGEGPFNENDLDFLLPWALTDETNVFNEDQGRFKYGYLNLQNLVYRIKKDFALLKKYASYAEKNLVFTCLDQVIPDKFTFISKSKDKNPKTSLKTFIQEVDKYRKDFICILYGQKPTISSAASKVNVPFKFSMLADIDE